MQIVRQLPLTDKLHDLQSLCDRSCRVKAKNSYTDINLQFYALQFCLLDVLILDGYIL